jgi:alpha-glucosidase
MTWRDAPEGVLSFSREPGFVCVVNLSAEPYELPGHSALLVASGPVEGGVLGPDQAVWLTV